MDPKKKDSGAPVPDPEDNLGQHTQKTNHQTNQCAVRGDVKKCKFTVLGTTKGSGIYNSGH